MGLYESTLAYCLFIAVLILLSSFSFQAKSHHACWKRSLPGTTGAVLAQSRESGGTNQLAQEISKKKKKNLLFFLAKRTNHQYEPVMFVCV
jgi:hypothetical protein